MRTLNPQPTLVDQVYESILAEITEGRFPMDKRLIQEELAEALGVSRQPVQQALLLLRSRGLLRDAPGRGLMVAPLDPDHVRDLMEVRAVLDGLATGKVAAAARDVAKKEGPLVLARGRAAVKEGSIAKMTEADMEFHFFLYRLSGNPLIGEICTPHWSYLRRVMGEVLRGQTPDEIWDQHDAILKAVISGDADRAERVARHHISHAAELLVGRLQSHLAQDTKPEARVRRSATQ
ncbi:MAG: GntR family transcriptional regulator [Betaproteobacteria bacterium]|nr:GntR family transcriptional regulator [Betaproteobacteria bacterium]